MGVTLKYPAFSNWPVTRTLNCLILSNSTFILIFLFQFFTVLFISLITSLNVNPLHSITPTEGISKLPVGEMVRL